MGRCPFPLVHLRYVPDAWQVYGIQGNTVYIDDPSNTKAKRVRGDYALFKRQVKYHWIIERPEHMKEDDDMDINDFINNLTDEQAYKLMQKSNRHAATLAEPDWSQKEGSWGAAIGKGLTDGTAPERPVKRCEAMAWLDRLGLPD